MSLHCAPTEEMTCQGFNDDIGKILNNCSFTEDNSDEKCFGGECKIMVSAKWIFSSLSQKKHHGISSLTKFKGFLKSHPELYILKSNWFQSIQLWDALPTEEEAFAEVARQMKLLDTQDRKTLANQLSRHDQMRVRFRTPSTVGWFLKQNHDELMEHLLVPPLKSGSIQRKGDIGHNQKGFNDYLKDILESEVPCLVADIQECLFAFDYQKEIKVLKGTIKKRFPKYHINSGEVVNTIQKSDVPSLKTEFDTTSMEDQPQALKMANGQILFQPESNPSGISTSMLEQGEETPPGSKSSSSPEPKKKGLVQHPRVLAPTPCLVPHPGHISVPKSVPWQGKDSAHAYVHDVAGLRQILDQECPCSVQHIQAILKSRGSKTDLPSIYNKVATMHGHDYGLSDDLVYKRAHIVDVSPMKLLPNGLNQEPSQPHPSGNPALKSEVPGLHCPAEATDSTLVKKTSEEEAEWIVIPKRRSGTGILAGPYWQAHSRQRLSRSKESKEFGERLKISDAVVRRQTPKKSEDESPFVISSLDRVGQELMIDTSEVPLVDNDEARTRDDFCA